MHPMIKALCLLSLLIPLVSCATRPVKTEVVQQRIDPALYEQCFGFRADPPPDTTDPKLHALWDARTYLRGLACENGVERIPQ